MAKKRDESPEERQSRLLTEARSAVPELPVADLAGFKRPKEATGELRLRRGWGHMLLVIDEVGRQFKLYRQPEKPAREKKAHEPEKPLTARERLAHPPKPKPEPIEPPPGEEQIPEGEPQDQE